MNIERINVNGITDIEDAKKVMVQILDCMFEMNRDIQRQLANLSSQNVRTLDFNITKVQNKAVLLKEYYTAKDIDEILTGYQKKAANEG